MSRTEFISEFGAPRHFLKRTAATPNPSCLNSCLNPLGGGAPISKAREPPLAPSRTGPVRGRAVLSKARGNPPHSIQPEFKRLRRALLLYRNFMGVASSWRLPNLYSRSFRGSSPGSCGGVRPTQRYDAPSDRVPLGFGASGVRRGRAISKARGTQPPIARTLQARRSGTSIARTLQARRSALPLLALCRLDARHFHSSHFAGSTLVALP